MIADSSGVASFSIPDLPLARRQSMIGDAFDVLYDHEHLRNNMVLRLLVIAGALGTPCSPLSSIENIY